MKYLFTILLLLPAIAFSGTTNIQCIYTSYSDMEGIHKMKSGSALELNFIVDDDSKESYLLGNNGSAKVHKIDGTEGITFIEVTGTGVVMTTAIAIDTMKSIHSRHSILLGEFIPSQNYGSCTVRN